MGTLANVSRILDRMNLRKQIEVVLQFTLAVLIVASLSGCSAVQVVVTFSPEIDELRQGEREFANGNYEQAAAIFEKIFDSNKNPQTKNTALYNLACTRIMTAESSEEYLEAVSLLESWQSTHPSVIYVENPNLVIAALRENSEIMAKDNETIIRQREELAELAQTIEKDKAILAGQTKTINDLKNALKTLQTQIAELEAIDQQLQEKKKPL